MIFVEAFMGGRIWEDLFNPILNGLFYGRSMNGGGKNPHTPAPQANFW